MPGRVDRRAFIGLAGAGLLSLVGCSNTSVAPPVPGLPWNELRRKLSGRLVRPGDAGFIELALPNNLRYAGVAPAGIALCATAADVAASILWARENGVPLVARSGGHSYAGYSTTSGLMIDVRTMNGFSFDSGTGLITLGGGARNAEVYAQCRKLGIAITHGRCHSVGVTGLALGGGIGFNMRANGLTCDQLVVGEGVLANGQTQGLRDGANDLFWACRGGGGGNFGINTSLTFRAFEVGEMTAYDLRWTSDLEDVFFALTQALESAPNTLGCKVSVFVSADPAHVADVQLLGQFAGTPAELHDIIQPAYAIAPPSSGFVERTSYWKAQDLLSEAGLPSYYQERSRFFDHAISGNQVATIFNFLRRWPGTAGKASFKLFQTGGRINAVAPGATAFVHRNSHWLAGVSIGWEATTPSSELRKNLQWQSAFYEAISKFAGGGAYQNFVDPSLTDWETDYYGANLARLESVKRRVDPNRVFRFPQAIP